ncbi:surface antigen repeat-containing domain protein [Ostertagia ostertagi]
MASDVINPLSKTWVRLQIEPVEVSTDETGIVFSSVQSVVPGAHGLYYRENGQRRPLDYDTSTGRILAPPSGWNAQNIYIHLAHGSKHGSHYADYTKASQQFEKNVSAVQKLIAAAGLTYGFAKTPKAEKTTRTSSRTRGVKSGFEAQPENVHISDESDNNTVNQLVEQKNREIEKLLDANEELKLMNKQLRAELRSEMLRNLELEQSLEKTEERQTEVPVQTSTASEVEQTAEHQEQGDNLEKTKLLLTEKDEELRKKDEEIAQLRARLGDVEKTVIVPEEAAVPHAQTDEKWDIFIQVIAELEKKITQMEEEKTQLIEGIQAEQLAVITEKDQHIAQVVEELETARNELRDAKNRIQELGEKEEEINNLHNVIADLRANLATAKKEKEESEWHLGEHKEWLSNSKEKSDFSAVQQILYKHDQGSPKARSGLENADESAKAQIRALETKLQLANQSFRNSEAERQKCEQINREAMKRVMQLESENGRLTGITEELSAKLRDSASAQVLEEKEARIRDLADERSRLQWRIGELSQWWSDAKWKIGELEAGVAHQRQMLDTANGKIQNLNDQLTTALRSPQTSSTTTYVVPPSFSVSQAVPGQWHLANTCFAPPPVTAPTPIYSAPIYGPSFYSAPVSYETKRVKIEIDIDTQQDVFVMGSFLNWQCALKCDPIGVGRRGLTLDLPRGRHEFRFLADGKWLTSSLYTKVPNGFGGDNNLLWIE